MTPAPELHTTAQHKVPSRWHHQLALGTCTTIHFLTSCLGPLAQQETLLITIDTQALELQP